MVQLWGEAQNKYGGLAVNAEYIIQLAKYSSELFKCSDYEGRRLLIKTVLTNVAWNSVNLCYDYKERSIYLLK